MKINCTRPHKGNHETPFRQNILATTATKSNGRTFCIGYFDFRLLSLFYSNPLETSAETSVDTYATAWPRADHRPPKTRTHIKKFSFTYAFVFDGEKCRKIFLLYLLSKREEDVHYIFNEAEVVRRKELLKSSIPFSFSILWRSWSPSKLRRFSRRFSAWRKCTRTCRA